MDSNILKTSVDDLYELVKGKKRISIEEASKILKLPAATVHSLVDFLVEERVFGIEYKFTTPYIYLSEESDRVLLSKEGKDFVTKDDFFKKALQRNIPEEKIQGLWRKYLEENIGAIKDSFYKKSYQKNLPKEQIDELWNKYLQTLQ